MILFMFRQQASFDERFKRIADVADKITKGDRIKCAKKKNASAGTGGRSTVVFLLLCGTRLDVFRDLPHGIFRQVVFEVVEEVNDLLVTFE